MYHVGEGARPCPFPPVTGNGHGRVTDPQGDHFSGRILGMIPKPGTRHYKEGWGVSAKKVRFIFKNQSRLEKIIQPRTGIIFIYFSSIIASRKNI